MENCRTRRVTVTGTPSSGRQRTSGYIILGWRPGTGPRSPAATIAHTDRGSHFRPRKFVHALPHNGLHGSMGHAGPWWDNAAMERSSALLQSNVLDRRRWHTRAQHRLVIVTSIERTYHRHRHQSALGRLTLVQLELLHAPAATAS